MRPSVPGRVRVHWLNLEGDQQSDLSVHGGVDKAVYAYPGEHYPLWREDLPGMELPWARNASSDLLRRAAEHPVLPETWRDYFFRQLTR